jgi:hypothetical protein
VFEKNGGVLAKNNNKGSRDISLALALSRALAGAKTDTEKRKDEKRAREETQR